MSIKILDSERVRRDRLVSDVDITETWDNSSIVQPARRVEGGIIELQMASRIELKTMRIRYGHSERPVRVRNVDGVVRSRVFEVKVRHETVCTEGGVSREVDGNFPPYRALQSSCFTNR